MFCLSTYMYTKFPLISFQSHQPGKGIGGGHLCCCVCLVFFACTNVFVHMYVAVGSA